MTKHINIDTPTNSELFKALDKVSEYNKLGGRGNGDLEDTCYICGISPANLQALINEQIIEATIRTLERISPDGKTYMLDDGSRPTIEEMLTQLRTTK